MKNIALIGMAGVGKTFISKKLSEKFGYQHIFVDDLINEIVIDQMKTTRDDLSDSEFLAIEEKVILDLADAKKSVIDTGGSVVYSEKAMEILKENSHIIYLSDSFENIEKRYKRRHTDSSKGETHIVGFKGGMTFKEIFNQRKELYEKYADLEINVSDFKNDPERFLDKIKNS
jgi:shikimate kinase